MDQSSKNGREAALRRSCRLLLIAGIFLLISGCSDPYEHEIPASGFVTAGQAEDISSDLKGEDKDLFKRWASRAATNERFPGESVPPSVKIALMNQTRYEALKAEEKVKAEEKLMADQRAYEEKVRAHEESRNLLKATDAFIKNYFVAKAIEYDIVPVFNSYGTLAYREWRFDLKLTNKTPKEIIGARGAVLVKDAFGKELGVYNVRMEPKIPPGKTLNYRVAMRHDPSDAGNVAMLNTQTIFPEWFFDSLAFSDGTAIDESTVAEASAANPEIGQEGAKTAL